jgi:hypothetical protein
MEKPKKSSGDYAHAIIKGSLSEIPLIGGTASEIFNLILAPPLEKRREKWLEEIWNRLLKLEQNVGLINVESLSYNDRFISTFLSAIQVALRNHADEKLKALQNLVINSVINPPVEEAIDQLFLNLIDTFTIWHFKVLEFLSNPQKWYDKNKKEPPASLATSLKNIILDAFPELKQNEDFLELIGDDLYSKGLITRSNLRDVYRKESLFIKHTSNLGEKFLKTIS